MIKTLFFSCFVHILKVYNLYLYYYSFFLDKRKVYLVKRMVQMFYFIRIDCLYLLFTFMCLKEGSPVQ